MSAFILQLSVRKYRMSLYLFRLCGREVEGIFTADRWPAVFDDYLNLSRLSGVRDVDPESSDL